MFLHRFFLLLVVLSASLPAFGVDGPVVTVSSLEELAKTAAQGGQTVRMKPGHYPLTDLVPLDSIADRRARGDWHYLAFSGNDNTFDLSGVTIELDTAVRQKLGAPIHTDEFLINGNNVMLKGLTITSKGQGTAFAGAVLGVSGKGVTLEDCTIHVEGSAPYGYGDLFGKGGRKHSGVHITGDGARFLGCKVYNRAFGHGFYLQEDCDDVLFENCYVEGVMRSTDEVLAETSGMAFDRKFRSEVKTRGGENRILPGYMKALSEDGFRTYHTHRNLVLRNCTAKNMRGGFELRTKSAPRLENCTVIGCERGFWISTGAIVKNCRGDAPYGPLLYVEGDDAKVEVQLLPTEAGKATVHALAAIYGSGNQVTITSEGNPTGVVPILVGSGPPVMGENMSPNPEKRTKGLVLRNETPMPVIIGAQATQCQIFSGGPVTENQGKDITIQPLQP